MILRFFGKGIGHRGQLPSRPLYVFPVPHENQPRDASGSTLGAWPPELPLQHPSTSLDRRDDESSSDNSDDLQTDSDDAGAASGEDSDSTDDL